MLGVMLLLLLLRREWKSFVCVYCLFDVSCFFFLFVPYFALFSFDLDDKYPFFTCRGGSLSQKDCVQFFGLFLFECNAIPSQKLKIQFLELR
jgi:hypothetical protein